MEIKKINEIIKKVFDYHNGSYNRKLNTVEKVSNINIHTGVPDDYGNQGEYNEIAYIYKCESYHVRILARTDSYGNNESIFSLGFVEAKQKTVSVFEEI